jgi:hypothetical protein
VTLYCHPFFLAIGASQKRNIRPFRQENRSMLLNKTLGGVEVGDWGKAGKMLASAALP